MHSSYTANALLTLEINILAFMCGFASFSDNFNSPTPTAEVQVLNTNWFQKKPDGDAEVFVFLAAEYETPKNSLNQEHAKLLIHTTNKYRFIDQGSNFRGKLFNLTLH